MKFWRPGITGKLFLAIFATCIVLLISMHWAVRISFERGFIDYIKHGNEQRLQLLSDALGEQAAMHARMQRLHAAVHHLGIARELLDGGYGNARILDSTSRTARRDDLDAKVIDQRPCEIDDARLIGNRDQRAGDLHIRSHAVLLSGTPPCSVSR